MSIGASAFARCSMLKTVAILPTSIDIGLNAFYNDSALTRIDATTDICEKVLKSCNGTCAQFRGCPIPSSAPTGSSPLSFLPSSRSPSSMVPTRSSSSSIININCSSCNKCYSRYYYYYTAVIPSGDTVIAANAFSWCHRLTAIVIPT